MYIQKCPICGAPSYDGLCWKCRAEQKRSEVLAWSEKQKEEKIRDLIRNVSDTGHMSRSDEEDFWGLLACHGIISEEFAREAVKHRIFRPNAIYYHAPADVRDGLITELLQTEDPMEADSLLSCLAMQGDDKSLEALYALEKDPKPWRKSLYVDPSSYAQGGGWTFDQNGQRRMLNFNTCYSMEREEGSTDKAAVIGRKRDDRCPHCKGQLTDILVLDGTDPRLQFLGIDGIFTATCCLNCMPYTSGVFSRFRPDGGSTAVFPYTGIGDDAQNYLTDAAHDAIASNPYVLGKQPRPLFYGARDDGMNMIGGFAYWVQDWQYAVCPNCGELMDYAAQIQWSTLEDNAEGTIYIEVCRHCHTAAMIYQQT